MSDSPSTPTPHAGEQAGATIGRYKLLEKIGEGGMGTIWLAEQREPVRRRVALKIIKLGMDTKQVIARFEAERQALALMDHPHIAKVFDAGATESGRPYFVMEYIKGVPIVDYCDQERLDMKARLDLFTKVCHAIQHAHHKGIIHRDIKPTNVLVTMMDGAPIPKVIDFGIAKATSGDLTPKTLFTEHRQMIGTPAYMSPEQAEMSGLDIDTRSDVYSLGVLLYEILTGTTPFDTKSLLEAGRAEMMRAIREDEPHTPSHRVSSLGDTASRTAQRRQLDLKRLGAQLRGDLDRIVMRCLEKDRARRYETANGLAADINRHLHGEPVAAGPPGAGYKLRKFVRRNRGVVAAVVLVACALVIGAAGTTTGMVRALDEKERADGEAEKAKLAAESEAKAKTEALENEREAVAAATSAEAAQKEEEVARKRAEAISDFVVTALQAGDAVNPGGGQGVTILAAMDRAIADIDSGRFKDDPEVEAHLRGTIGTILQNNGRSQQALLLLTEQLKTLKQVYPGDQHCVWRALNDLGCALMAMDRIAEAEPLLVQALEMAQRHFPGDHQDVLTSLGNVANARQRLGRECKELHVQVLEMTRRLYPGDHLDVALSLNNLAQALPPAEAEPLLVETLEMSQRLLHGDHPRIAQTLDNLGKARLLLGRLEDGDDLLTRALAMRRRLFHGDHPDVALGLNNLAWARQMRGRLEEAEPLFVESLEMRKRLYPGDHPMVASAMGSLGSLMLDRGRAAEAEPFLAQALAMHRRTTPGGSLDQAKILDLVGSARKKLGRFVEAEAALAEALAMRRRLYEHDDPNLATSIRNLASARLELGRHAEADALATESLEMWLRLTKGDRPEVAEVLRLVATARSDAGHPAEAEAPALQSLETYQRMRKGDDQDVAFGFFTLATVREALGRLPEAESLYEKAVAMMERLSPADDSNLVTARGRLALVYYSLGKLEKSVPLYEDVLKRHLERLGRQDPEALMMIGNLGANYAATGRFVEAIPLLEEAQRAWPKQPRLGFVGPHLLEAWSRVADLRNPDDLKKVVTLSRELVAHARGTTPPRSPELSGVLAQCSMALLAVEAWDEAEPLLRESLTIREKTEPDAWRTFNTRSLLGGALLGQKKLGEAEPLLLDGYRGMKEREASIPPPGATRIPEALERLVRLYEARGNTTEAAAWRVKLDAARATESRPASRQNKR